MSEHSELRDLFACIALWHFVPHILADRMFVDSRKDNTGDTKHMIARLDGYSTFAYDVADSMLKARQP